MHSLIDAEVQAIVDTNAADIEAVFPSLLQRAFKEDEEFLSHPTLRVYTHFTNLKMICLRSPSEAAVRPLVAAHPKNGKFLVKENEPLVEVGSEIFPAPFDAEISAFGDVASHYVAFANRKFPKKRKNLEA